MPTDHNQALRAALAGLLEYCAERDPGQGDPEQDDPRVTAAGAALTQPAASGEPADPDPLHLSRILHEMAGAVSMCWEPRPSGVFESSTAAGFVADAIAEIRSRMPPAQPAPALVPLTDDEAHTAYRNGYPGTSAPWGGFLAGVRYAERAHGITVPD